MKKASLPIVIAFCLLIFMLVRGTEPSVVYAPEDIIGVKIAGEDISVDLALTPEEQAKGLSGRLSLDEEEGMLFVFQQPGRHYFWMKGMNFPIDMIWIGEDMKVIYIKKDASPENFLDTYGPDTDSKYVLEVVSGFSDLHGLEVGDPVLFTY